jgi:hypothetical protein
VSILISRIQHCGLRAYGFYDKIRGNVLLDSYAAAITTLRE